MSAVSKEFRIPKLDQDNYYAWSIRARAGLIQRNCWEAIEPGYDLTQITENEARLNRKALAFILLIVSDSYLDDIGHCDSAKEAWDILQDLN